MALKLPPEPRFRTDTEREVLRVLWNHRNDQPMVRSQVHKRLEIPKGKRPTVERVGQLLKALHAYGYLDKIEDRYQGQKLSGFYQLSETGVAKCLEHYTFDQQERVLFQASEETLAKYLTPKNFRGSPDAPVRRIVGFYSHSGGVGQSTMVAHTGNGLALNAPRKDILIIDFDMDAPVLDRFFPDNSESVQASRGLRGLLVDFYQQNPWDKKEWIRQVVVEDTYVSQARPKKAPNLFYLRSGMHASTEVQVASERATALRYLQSELQSSQTREGVGGYDFLSHLREALLSRYHLVVVDTHAGRNLGVRAMTQIADQLVVNARASEKEESLRGTRATIAIFFEELWARNRSTAGILLVLHLSEFSGGQFDAEGWLQANLIASGMDLDQRSYKIWKMLRNEKLEEPWDWQLTVIFEPLVKRLLGIRSDREYQSPELQAIDTVLGLDADSITRQLAADMLEDIGFSRMILHLERFLKNRYSKSRFDPKGLALIEQSLDLQYQSFRKSLRGK